MASSLDAANKSRHVGEGAMSEKMIFCSVTILLRRLVS